MNGLTDETPKRMDKVQKSIVGLFCVIVFSFLALPAAVQAQFTFVTNNGAITITGYTGSGGTVVIPDTINDYPVTSIGDDAFFGSGLTSVSIPDSIISIGDESFNGCMSLTNVAIPNSVTSIGESAFGGCTNLSSITIPNNVTNIGVDAFLYCLSMTNISVDAGNPDFSSLNGILFDKAQDTLIECPSGLTNSAYAIPSGVVTIAEDAFDFCRNVTSFTIPGSVTNIIGPPFNDCTGLTNICVNAANPAYSSLNGVLYDKAQDTLVQYPPGLKNASYTIPNSVSTIQGDAFSFCAYLVNITIPNNVTNIGEWGTFLGCSSLASVVIPNGVTDIPDYAFYGCTSLAGIIIPNTITNIGWQAFSECDGLTNVIVPASVTTIGNFAFANSSALASAYFEGNAFPANGSIFYGDPTTIYYLSGTTGWETTYGSAPTELWLPQMQTVDASFGIQTNPFNFNISWASGQTVVVEACTNLANPIWIPVSTNTLSNSGTSSFCDSQWTNYPCRFYRISGP